MIIDLGCGKYPRQDADVKVDITKHPHVTHCHDLNVFPYPFGNSVANKIYLYDVVEHFCIFSISNVIRECHRMLIPGGVLDITCPDVRWIADRISKGDWSTRAKGDWLNRYPTPFENAMSYLFGGFYNREEWAQKGMGHIAGYDEATLINVLKTTCPWTKIQRVPDQRNECILRVMAVK